MKIDIVMKFIIKILIVLFKSLTTIFYSVNINFNFKQNLGFKCHLFAQVKFYLNQIAQIK